MTEFYDVTFLAPPILNAQNKIFGPKLAHSSSFCNIFISYSFVHCLNKHKLAPNNHQNKLWIKLNKTLLTGIIITNLMFQKTTRTICIPIICYSTFLFHQRALRAFLYALRSCISSSN